MSTNSGAYELNHECSGILYKNQSFRWASLYCDAGLVLSLFLKVKGLEHIVSD